MRWSADFITDTSESEFSAHTGLLSSAGGSPTRGSASAAGGCGAGRQSNDEAGAFPRFADDTDVTAHHAAKTARDREAETGPAIAPCGGLVTMGELLKKLFVLFLRHADPRIGDGKLDPPVPIGGCGADLEGNLTILGEFACIAQKIEENLPRPAVDQRREP
jgi:hypothetical protein